MTTTTPADLFRASTARDPRWYQIAALTLLVVYGAGFLHFEIGAAQAAVTLATALAAQWLGTRACRLPVFDPKSALISGLSLCLLLRTNSLLLAAAAAALAIASKFVLRVNGKHVFNPTNFGIVTMLLVAGNGVWVSPGQWGSVAFFAFLLACLGGLVVHRAARSDVTVAFIACWLALQFGRALWLGDPVTIPLHRLENGALLLFMFFMISDPKTTPDTRAGRLVFAALVAVGAWYWQFKLFHTNGLLWSLAACAMLTPAIDAILRGRRYAWTSKATEPLPTTTVTVPA